MNIRQSHLKNLKRTSLIAYIIVNNEAINRMREIVANAELHTILITPHIIPV